MLCCICKYTWMNSQSVCKCMIASSTETLLFFVQHSERAHTRVSGGHCAVLPTASATWGERCRVLFVSVRQVFYFCCCKLQKYFKYFCSRDNQIDAKMQQSYLTDCSHSITHNIQVATIKDELQRVDFAAIQAQREKEKEYGGPASGELFACAVLLFS